MARLPAVFALAAAVLVLAAGIRPGHGQLELLTTNPVTGCLELPGGKLPSSPLLDAYKFLANLQPMRIDSWHIDTKLSVASNGKGHAVLAKTNCGDPRQLWFRDSFSPSRLNGTAVSDLTIPREDEPFALVSLGAMIDSKELQAMQYVEGRVYPDVKLARYSQNSVPPSMLWTKDAKIEDGSYKMRPLKNSQRYLACPGENSYVDTVHWGSVEPGYFQWKIQGFLPNDP